VDDILRSTTSTIEQVTIEPNGEWHTPAEHNESTITRGESSNTEGEDDDLIEIQDARVLSLKQEPLPMHLVLQHTPSLQPREASAMSLSSRQSTNKRPASVVIDLTGSDDDDIPLRSSKRPSYNSSNQFILQAYGDFQSGGGLNNTSFGASSQSSSNSPAPASYYYDA
jgi:E3 SUMO-protein ligase PIAS1